MLAIHLTLKVVLITHAAIISGVCCKNLKDNVNATTTISLLSNASAVDNSSSIFLPPNISSATKKKQNIQNLTFPTPSPTPVTDQTVLSPPVRVKDGGRHSEYYKQSPNSMSSLSSFNVGNKLIQHVLEESVGYVVDKLEHPLRTVLELIRLLEVPLPFNVSETCKRHVRLIFSEALDTFIEERDPLKEWSLQMLDAVGKPPSGILEGTLVWPGSYVQCTNIIANEDQTNEEAKVAFVGEHCFLRARIMDFGLLDQYLNWTLGMCYPSSCDTDDKQNLINYITTLLPLKFNVEEEQCHNSRKKSPMDTVAVLISIILLIPVVAIVVATSLNVWANQIKENVEMDILKSKEGVATRILSVFCLNKNWNRLFAEPKNALIDFSFIQGMRCLSILWIMYAHAWVEPLLDFGGPIREILTISDEFTNINLLPVMMGGIYAVDTFFFLSGFCAVYFFLKWSKNATSVKETLIMYPTRYFRLTPSFAFVAAFVAGPWMYLGNGPFWPTVAARAKTCRSVWWTNLLYISNFGENLSKAYCLDQTWYLMVDMQVFLITPPLLFLLTRKPKWTVLVIVAMYLAAVVSGAFIVHANKFSEYSLMKLEFDRLAKSSDDVFQSAYSNPLLRVPGYLLGMLHGYFMYHTTSTTTCTSFHLKWQVVAAGWAICIGTTSALVYFPYPFNAGYVEAPYALQLLFCVTSRTLWCVPLAWIIFACSTGRGDECAMEHGRIRGTELTRGAMQMVSELANKISLQRTGMVTRFLSWKPFVVIGRLSFCIYLTHEMVLYSVSGAAVTTRQLDPITTLCFILSLLVFSTAAAIVLYLLIEAPLSSIKSSGKAKETCSPLECNGHTRTYNETATKREKGETKALLDAMYDN